jgi:choline dehydrogenase
MSLNWLTRFFLGLLQRLRIKKILVAFLCSALGGTSLGLLKWKLFNYFQYFRGNLEAPLTTQAEFDYIIVGGGNSGCVLAHDLARALPDAKILLLEAGKQDDNMFIHIPGTAFLTQHAPKSGDPDLNWGYRSTAQFHTRGRVHVMPRAKVLGGCSAMNFMLYVRGHPEDYNRWEKEYGCTGWGYRDVLPVFTRHEGVLDPHLQQSALRNTRGPWKVSTPSPQEINPLSLAFLAACAQLGIAPTDDYNGGDTRGCARAQLTIDARGERCNVARAFLSRLKLQCM